METTHKNARIAILGAGPAGLAAAQYLKERGYRDVVILEKLGRVGGLAKSITDGYRSFDLGANYFTPAYTETIRFAKQVKAKSYKAKDYKILMQDGTEWKWMEVVDYVTRDDQGRKIGTFKIRAGCKKFLEEWEKVREHVGSPTYKTVKQEPSLHMTFAEWLDSKDLGFLKRLFEIPIPMMGYGLLDEIPAPYALKYMEPKTFRVLTKRMFVWNWLFAGSTRRFTLGFQRMFEELSWGLNVRSDVTVTKIRRSAEGIRPVEIEMHYPERIFLNQKAHEVKHHFDKLIIACPLLPEVLFDEAGMKATSVEKRLFDQVDTYHYCQTTLHAVQDEVDGDGQEVPFKLPAPVVPVMPFSRQTFNRPWALVQVWEDDSRMMQIYSRMENPPLDLFRTLDLLVDEKEQWRDAFRQLLLSTSADPYDEIVPRANSLLELFETKADFERELVRRTQEVKDLVDQSDANRDKVVKEAEDLLSDIGAKVAGEASGRLELGRWRTFHEWPYFGHLSVDEFRDGWFEDLDAIQGENHTYYAGGATTFELVEAVLRSAKYAVERMDADLRREAAQGRTFYI